ncbi:hypothetical protein CYMTET_16785, partial [Cymbomonas tetramitiformis]
CGKSSLLNALCGKNGKIGEISGEILVNSTAMLMSALKRVIGFVPQDDTVFGELTVLENIQYSGKMRLAGKYTKASRQKVVEGVLEVLGLKEIQNSIVGTVTKRGISGGQKKRVNIGVEMVADPSVLFLDEPTSGLGATDTLVVMKALHSLALTQRSVVAVIHQPRFQVFLLFHKIMLLYPGGKLVFFGESTQAEPYFKSLGLVCPKNENPADFFLDIISGSIVKDAPKEFSPHQLPTNWEEHVVPVGLADYLKLQEARAKIQVMTVDDALKEVVGTPKSPASRTNGEAEKVGLSILANHGEDEPEQNLQIMRARADSWFEQLERFSGDLNGGIINIYTIQAMLEDLGMTTNKDEAEVIFRDIDKDASGEITRQEFMEYLNIELKQEEEEEEEDNEDDDDDDVCPDGPGNRSSFASVSTAFSIRRSTHMTTKTHKNTMKSTKTDERAEEERRSSTLLLRAFELRRRKWRVQFYHLLRRGCLQKLRGMNEVLTNFLVLSVCGIFVGALLSADHQSACSSLPHRQAAMGSTALRESTLPV